MTDPQKAMTESQDTTRPPSRDSQHGNDPYIFTTIRWQPELAHCAANTAASGNRPCPFYMLEHHWTRLQVAKWIIDPQRIDRARDSTSDPSQLFQGLANAVQQWQKSHPSEEQAAGALRIRLRCHVGGRVATETYFPLEKLPMSSLFPGTLGTPEALPQAAGWTVVLDSETTTASESTMFKTSDRRVYERAREAARLEPTEATEVLLRTPEGEVLDGSISTPYFFRAGRWVTPAASSGGLQGTTRRWSLEKGLCVEGTIPVDNLREGEIVWLSNAVRGYFAGVYRLRKCA